MNEKIKCNFCGEEFAKNVIKRHEDSCKKNPKNIKNKEVEKILTTAQKLSQKAKGTKGRVRVPKDTEIIIMKNVLGGWTYEDSVTKKIFRMAHGSVTTIMTMGELLGMHSRHPKMLNEFMIVPIDTFDDNYTAEDVIENLNLTKLYASDIRPDEIEECILNMPVYEFNEVINKISKSMKARIIEKAIDLFRKGEFTDATKKNIIIQMADNNEMIFNIQE